MVVSMKKISKSRNLKSHSIINQQRNCAELPPPDSTNNPTHCLYVRANNHGMFPAAKIASVTYRAEIIMASCEKVGWTVPGFRLPLRWPEMQKCEVAAGFSGDQAIQHIGRALLPEAHVVTSPHNPRIIHLRAE